MQNEICYKKVVMVKAFGKYYVKVNILYILYNTMQELTLAQDSEHMCAHLLSVDGNRVGSSSYATAELLSK